MLYLPVYVYIYVQHYSDTEQITIFSKLHVLVSRVLNRYHVMRLQCLPRTIHIDLPHLIYALAGGCKIENNLERLGPPLLIAIWQQLVDVCLTLQIS